MGNVCKYFVYVAMTKFTGTTYPIFAASSELGKENHLKSTCLPARSLKKG